MLNKTLVFSLFLFFFSATLFAQDKATTPQTEEVTPKEVTIVDPDGALQKKKNKKIDPLSPSKAAFYSAILPGLGQAYNGKYWKIPIVYAFIGTGIYFYIDNNNELKRYRNAYKRRLAGFTDDEFQNRVTTDGLIDAQETLRRNKELSLLVTVGLYALNIIEANVDAHLLQYNVDDNLSLKPHYKINEQDFTGSVGVTVNFQF